MKVLIAAEGKSLDNIVARKFSRASHFLEVDADTLDCTVVPDPGHHERGAIITNAAGRGALTVIAGNIGPHGFSLMSANGMQVAFAPGVPAREALEKLQRGELKIIDAPTIAKSIEDREQHRKQRRMEHGRHQKGKHPGGGIGPTQRGRHHLQQFGGRGH